VIENGSQGATGAGTIGRMPRARPDEWREHAAGELRRAGHRSGGARTQVLELLAAEPCLTSAQEIHDKLRERDRRVGLASVYRALEVLAGLGLVHRVEVEGVACFEAADPTGDHHHHAICAACGTRAAFSDDDLERLIEAIGARVGFDLDAHDVVLRGRCPDCRATG
jgi:Fur family ferric uptake transcriptional regulator